MGADHYLPAVLSNVWDCVKNLMPQRPAHWVTCLERNCTSYWKPWTCEHGQTQRAGRIGLPNRDQETPVKGGRLHGNHPLVRGTDPKDNNLVPSEASRWRKRHSQKCSTRQKINKLGSLGRLSMTSDDVEYREAAPQDSPHQSTFPSERRWWSRTLVKRICREWLSWLMSQCSLSVYSLRTASPPSRLATWRRWKQQEKPT